MEHRHVKIRAVAKLLMPYLPFPFGEGGTQGNAGVSLGGHEGAGTRALRGCAWASLEFGE